MKEIYDFYNGCAEIGRLERGLGIATGISKYSSNTWALSVCGEENNYIDDKVFLIYCATNLPQEITIDRQNIHI